MSFKTQAFPVCVMTPQEVKDYVIKREKPPELSLMDYYSIEDATSSLERLRAYQWQDFLGKYKIF